MSALLASIASLGEIEIAIAGGADIVDLKDPAKGALGAWAIPRIVEATSVLRGRRQISATVGDLPMEPKTLAAAVRAVSGAGVDIVKIGMFEGERRECIAALAGAAAAGTRLAAVLFADREPDFALLPVLRNAGFFAVMLDTADKSGGALRDHMNDHTIALFATAARSLGLRVGLAGSLMPGDIAPLMRVSPEFLGFRRALCGAKGRTGAIDAQAVAALRAELDAQIRQSAKARKAKAVAGAHTAAK